MSTNHRPQRHFKVVAILVTLAMCLTPIASQLAVAAPAAAPGVWGSGTLTDQNLHDLIAQMTVAEEDTFVHGSSDNACNGVYVSPWVQGCVGQAGWIPGIPTLGIPPLRLDDGPAGSRLGHVATAMPAPIGLTASFDRSIANLFGVKVGAEQRSLNQDVWLAPMMNTVNVPTAGRNFETTGEDPYLSGEMASQIVQGSQSVGFIATVKHYADNDFENGRSSTSVIIDERTQHEVELQAFEKSLKAGAGAIMCSYNRVNDVYACGNDLLLNQIARGLFGFKGFVMSDWGATHTTQDLINGLDMEQSGSANLGTRLVGYTSTGSPAAGVSIALAIALIYMLLASQFESFVYPLIVLCSVPLSITGVLVALFLSGRSIGLTAMIGMLMLVGIVVKNGILLVDYTNVLRRRGIPREDAVLTAGPTRLRPILMTASAAMLGMLPLALALGKGSEVQAPMATAVIGGLMTSTFLTLFVVPTVYVVLDDIGAKLRGRREVYVR